MITAFSDSEKRQQLLTIIFVVVAIFLVFYWTYLLVNKLKSNIEIKQVTVVEKIIDIQNIAAIINNPQINMKLNRGLMSYIQEIQKASNIKFISSSTGQEQVTFRTNDILYDELIFFIKTFEKYNNIWIKNMSIVKRYDNNNRLDVSWDVVRYTN